MTLLCDTVLSVILYDIIRDTVLSVSGKGEKLGGFFKNSFPVRMDLKRYGNKAEVNM